MHLPVKDWSCKLCQIKIPLAFGKGLFFDKDSRHRSGFPVFQNFRHHKMWLFYSMFSATFKTN